MAEDKKPIDAWQEIEIGGIAQLEKTFKFNNFVDALNFTNKVGELAEEHNHHPAITTEWGKVSVRWWTHTERGISPLDTKLAALCDSII